MDYSEVIREVKKSLKDIDLSLIKEHIAVEVDVEGEGEGAFYIELGTEKVIVMPYEYYDRDIRIRGQAHAIIDILDGKLPLKDSQGLVRWEGNLAKAAVLRKVLDRQESKVNN